MSRNPIRVCSEESTCGESACGMGVSPVVTPAGRRCHIRGFAFASICFLLGAVAPVGCDNEPGEGPRLGESAPNIFLIVIDAASAPYFGCYGDTHGTSPNIDRLAAESVLFEQAYSQTATTISSTASLLTGVRATTHLMTITTQLPQKLPTLAQVLSKQGMKTYGFIGNPLAGAEATGLARGYGHCVQVYDLERLQGKRAKEETSRFYVALPEDVNSEVFKALPGFGAGGSFAYIHYLQPHKPYDPPQEYRKGLPCGRLAWGDLHVLFELGNEEGKASASTIRQLEARYRANIRYVDAGVGKLLDRLRQDKLYDESLIILMADHGDAFFKHRRFGHNTTLYDDMTRIPLMVKLPRSVGVKPRRVRRLVETIDVLPTLFDELGLPIPDRFEGDSLLPLINGSTRKLQHPEVVTCVMSRQKHAIRIGDYKYIFNMTLAEELYDLATDPDEQHNLARKKRDVAQALRKKLESMVDLASGKTLETQSHLRDDPKMNRLLDSLGYVGGGDTEDVETPTTQPVGP